MSPIKASDLSYCRLQVPDLAAGERFLVDFGLSVAARESGRIYFRGTDAHRYCYVLQDGGEARFLGFGLRAKSADDLHELAKRKNVRVEAIDAPGRGFRVRLIEPNGYEVDLVHGIDPLPPISVKRPEFNSGSHPLRRAGELYRVRRGEPTPVKRLAHVVLATPKVAETVNWFSETLGMIPSDNVTAGPNKALIGSFMRVDDGADYVDHHSLFVVAFKSAGLQHVSFEVQDVDAVLSDHHYLQSLGKYEHMWGVGRHLLGSQVFDYWLDPFGYAHEHWADSDRLNASTPTNVWDVSEAFITQWGHEPPERFKVCVRP